MRIYIAANVHDPVMKLYRSIDYTPQQAVCHNYLTNTFSTSSGTLYEPNFRYCFAASPVLPARHVSQSTSTILEQSGLTSQPDEEVHHHLLQDAHVLLHPTTLVGFLPNPTQSWDPHVGVCLCGQMPAVLVLILVMCKQQCQDFAIFQSHACALAAAC